MKAMKTLIAAAAVALCASGAANASIVTDTLYPLKTITTATSPYTYWHDLTDNGVPGSATVNWASLDVYLADPLLGNEKVTFKFNGTNATSVQNVPFLGQNYTFGVATSLLSTGLLQVALSVGCNGSIFGLCWNQQTVTLVKSELTADITPIPEPATLLTLGAGLLGLGAVRRRHAARSTEQLGTAVPA
ncbi:PEP-CTERM sorting domain-containing protein [Massilia niastensis]|uniref:PEP-CTERM sorting domain-containing protein n=1 Tax=Massilia niastensis TaxID=544911 RepID=UPI0003726280|nr:PEP-CTERM sorting domain-containing protein [Massilia niastensis]